MAFSPSLHVRLTAMLVLLVATVLGLASPAAAQYFTIDRYHSDIAVDEKGTMTVTERIELTFDRPRHGIYREIPYKYRTDLE
jgi:hypothetical protein